MIQMELRDEIMRKTLNSGKERRATLNREFIHHEQTPEEGIKSPQLDQNKNYDMSILHQIKLMKSSGFAYYLFFLKRLKKDIAPT